MRDEGNAFVGQWEITEAGEAKRIPSRVVTLGGPELLIGGLTALERDIVREREIDWQTYGSPRSMSRRSERGSLCYALPGPRPAPPLPPRAPPRCARARWPRRGCWALAP